jgi:hypothetical protein
LTSEEQIALSAIFLHLRQTPKDLLQLAKKCTHGYDLNVLSFLVVNRLFHPWSTDQKQLERLLDTLINDQTLSTMNLIPIEDGSASSVPLGTCIATLTEFSQLLSMSAVQQTLTSASPTILNPLLITLLYEIYCRGDTLAFLETLCSDVSFQTISLFTTVTEICTKLVEPLVLKLETAMESNRVPDCIVHVMKLLSRNHPHSLHGRDFLSTCIVLFVRTTLQIYNKQKEEVHEAFLDEEQLIQLSGRVVDLLLFCFNHEIGRKLKLCLIDAAALSRSKLVLSR